MMQKMLQVDAMQIDESGMLSRVSILNDGEYYYTDYNGPRFRADPTQQETLRGWGSMDGTVVALVDADNPARAEFWIRK